MTTTIALAGKGGTGKTTIAGLLIRYLKERRDGAILAIDADPSSNLHFVLGMELYQTIGEIREDMLEKAHSSGALAGSMPGGMSKQEWLDYQVQMSLVEGKRIDLLAMGRPEGPGCYCAANQMLRVIIDRLNKQYDYVVIDNEAGMEHLSRRTTRDVDVLLLVTDPTQRGLIAAKRMKDMVPGLEINVGHVYLVVNRARGRGAREQGSKGAREQRSKGAREQGSKGAREQGSKGAREQGSKGAREQRSKGAREQGGRGAEELPAPLAEAIAQADLDLIGTVPEDPSMAAFEFTGRPLVELPAETDVYRAVRRLAERILQDGRP